MKPIITHLLRGVKIGSIIFVVLALFAPLYAFSNNTLAVVGDKATPIEIVPADESMMGFAFSITNATVQKGGELCAQVKVTGFTSIVALQFQVKFDSTRLTYKESKNFNLAGLNTGSMNNSPSGTLRVSWIDNQATGITLADGTAIFDICFTALNVDATTNIRFVYQEVANANLQNVPVDNTLPPAVITIGTGGSGGGSINTLALDISDATVGAINQEVCVKLNTVSGFTSLKSGQFTINYNTTQLNFGSVKNFNLAGLSAASFTTTTPGVIAVNWTSTTPTTGTTVGNGIALADLCFTAKLAGITSTLSFAAGGNIQNKDNQAVTLNGTTGVITVSGGTGTTGPATFDLTDASGTVGQEVCLKVNVTNFTNLLSTEYTITYNTAQLDFSAVKSFNLTGLTISSFSTPGTGGTPAGSVKVSWNDPLVSQGVSVANGTSIFEVCFKPKLNNVTSTVTFAAASEIINKDDQSVTFSGLPGTITTGTGDGGSSTGVTLDLTDASIPGTNQEVCQQVTVNGFTNLNSLEFIINYNTTHLDFSAVKGLNLKGLTESSFGLPGQGTNPPGSVKVSWNDPDVSGVTLANGTAIFQVCFRAKITNIVSAVTFATNPAPEAIDKDNNPVPFTGQPGNITVGNVANTADVRFVVGNQNGAMGQDICVKVSVTDFTGISAVVATMNYDPTALQFKNVTNLNLNGLSQASFTPPGTGGVTAGSLRLNWSNNTAGGITVASSTNIFDVCFTPLKTGTSQVGFNSTGLSVTRATGGQPAGTQLTAGTVTINTVATSDLTLKVGSASGSTNSDVCVELTATNFKNVIGMQFAIKFDRTFLTFKSVDNLNTSLRGFTAGTVNGDNNTGFINVAWVDDQVQTGGTLPDNAVIMRMCFTIKGTSGSSTVGIDKTKTIELTDVAEKNIPTQTQDGTISVGSANAPAIVSPAVITNVPCFGESKGAINIEVRNGTAPYTYRWSNNATTQDLTNLAAGSYSVTVTDAAAATAVGTFNITQPTAALAITGVNKTDANCFGQGSGSLTATVTGGTTPLTYAWSGSLAAVANPTNVPAGSYTLTVTDANGCRAVSSPTVVAQPTAALNASTGSQPAKCDGTPTGSATITATGGTGPYTYRWANNQTTNQLSNLAAGAYSFTVTDSKNCTFTGSVTVAQEQSVRITSIDPVNFDQNTTNGAVNIAITGGVGPYRYSWTGPSNFSATTEDIANLGTAGQYCVTVTDNANCVATMCANIVQRLKVNLTVTEACFGQNTGGVSLQASGGVGPYTYRWSTNNVTTQNITNVAAGNYTVTVTDSQNTSVTGNALVPGLSQIAIARTVTDVNFPGGSNGAIALTVTGGKPGYTYRWSNNNSTANSLSALPVGEYCVTVTDLAGCTATGCFRVELVTAPLAVANNITDNKCNGESAGIARLLVSGGVGPYVLAFNNGQPQNLNAGVFERTNLAAGTYTYKVTDSRNTVFDGSFTVKQPDPLAISSFAVRHDSEEPGCTGSIALSITGGTPGYQVAWNSPNVGFQIINLCEGNFIPSVIDANGCRKTFEPIALTSFTLTAAITNTSCPDDKDGGINVTLLGGSAPYRVAWLSARGDTISKSEDLVDVPAGAYRFVVRENSGNRIERLYNVTTASRLSASIQILSNFNGFAVSCAEAKDGSARATGQNGGGTGYVYEWLQNNTLVVAAQTMNNAAAGLYTIRITDGLGCSVEEDVELLAPNKIELDAFITNISCVGNRDGEIAVEVAGGLAGGKFTYIWTNARSTPRITGLPKGSYGLTVTDRNNCTAAKIFEVREPVPVTVKLESINATEGCNGQVLAQAKGGQKPYTYRWNAPVTSGDSIVKSLCPGDYFVQVTDANGCKTTPDLNAIEVKDRRLPCMDIRSVISPDGDGSNETFLINCIQEFPGNKLFIYNRWGQLVFQAENYDNDWNGTTQSGELLPEGAYYYILEYKNADGKDIQARGSITLLREE